MIRNVLFWVTVMQLMFSPDDFCMAANILGVVPIPSYSHQIIFRPIWRELSLRGHKVTVLTTDPMNDKSLTNLTEIDWHFAYDLWNVKHNLSKIIREHNFFTIMDRLTFMLNDIANQELEHPEVQKLIKDEKAHFDLLLVENLMPTMMAFSVRFKCPFIGITSLDAPPYLHGIMGNPIHPVLYPHFMLPFSEKLSLIEKLVSVFYYLYIEFIVYSKTYALEDQTVRKHFGETTPRLEDIEKNISMMFINVNPIFSTIRPVGPLTIQIGGGIHLEKPKPLPKDLQNYLDTSTEGVIYFSLGSNVKSKDMPLSTRKAIMDALAELPYKILWKFEADLPGKPSNVKISKWIPQQDVLRHKNIKLFITQGGLQSLEESLLNFIPVVGVPFLADQQANVQKVVNKGMGLMIDHERLDKNTFKNAILEVINNPTYKNNARKLAEITLDQPMTGIEKAVWWTEYLLRHKNTVYLKSPAADIKWWEYFMLDILALVLTVATILIYVTVKLYNVLCSLVFRSGMKFKTQ